MLYFNPRSHEGSDDNRTGDIKCLKISILAPTRGATRFICEQYAGLSISIHAPTRGATVFKIIKSVGYTIFQSTLPRGERPQPVKIYRLTGKFQSTLPRGERHFVLGLFRVLVNFNPRSHEGSDTLTNSGEDASTNISIHAPTRGATCCRYSVKSCLGFQSTLPRGERR